MNNQKADELICRAVAIAAVLGVGSFLYYLWACGVSVAGLLVGLGMTVFVSAITVAVAVLEFRSKEE
jgi:hypothetical protein